LEKKKETRQFDWLMEYKEDFRVPPARWKRSGSITWKFSELDGFKAFSVKIFPFFESIYFYFHVIKRDIDDSIKGYYNGSRIMG
jgi:hypothetical protein